jgi:hypothetical protein
MLPYLRRRTLAAGRGVGGDNGETSPARGMRGSHSRRSTFFCGSTLRPRLPPRLWCSGVAAHRPHSLSTGATNTLVGSRVVSRLTSIPSEIIRPYQNPRRSSVPHCTALWPIDLIIPISSSAKPRMQILLSPPRGPRSEIKCQHQRTNTSRRQYFGNLRCHFAGTPYLLTTYYLQQPTQSLTTTGSIWFPMSHVALRLAIRTR